MKTLIASAIIVALLIGCDKKTDPPPSATLGAAVANADDKKVEPAKAVAPSAPAYNGPAISNEKNFLGLTLPPQGHWKPKYDADAKVAKWEDDDYFTGIVIRIVDDKLDTIDDLKEAAPMMMQLGTAVTKVIEEKKTDKGWYAIVEREKDQDLVYVRKFGKTTVCSALISKSFGKTISKAEALKACEAYSPNTKG